MKNLFNKHYIRDPLLYIVIFSEILYLFHFKWLLIPALIIYLAARLDLPKFFDSLFSRGLMSFLILFSLIQVIEAFTFLFYTFTGNGGTIENGFEYMSIALVLFSTIAVILYGINKKKNKFISNRDKKALLATLVFIVPVLFLFFKTPDPVRILSFAGIQSPDGAAHSVYIREIEESEVLTYKTFLYYPKGFHYSEAFIQDSLGLNQLNKSWIFNLRLYVSLYVFWGFIAAIVILYLAYFLYQQRAGPGGKNELLLALTVIPVVTVLYLIPFIYLGFLNYYFILAAILLAAIMLMSSPIKLTSLSVASYLILFFAVSMSWGPLLFPAFLLLPILMLSKNRINTREIISKASFKNLCLIISFLIIEVIPVYIHLKYSKLNSAQGINALGIMRDFHYGIVLLGIIFIIYSIHTVSSNEFWQKVRSLLLPFTVLVGTILVAQLFLVGEARYYSIKISYILEIIILIIAAILVIGARHREKNDLLNWIETPVVFFIGAILIVSISGNAFLPLRQTFRSHSNYGFPEYYETDLEAFSELGRQGLLRNGYNVPLHYNYETRKYTGNGLLMNVANLLQKDPKGTQKTADCATGSFQIFAYGNGSQQEQINLIRIIKNCIQYAHARGQKYYIITDKQSLNKLKLDFGDKPTYVIN